MRPFGFPGLKKCNFYCVLPFTFLSEMEIQLWRNAKQKKPFEIVLHVGRVTSLQSWVAKIMSRSNPYK